MHLVKAEKTWMLDDVDRHLHVFTIHGLVQVTFSFKAVEYNVEQQNGDLPVNSALITNYISPLVFIWLPQYG